jgi:hypothetical protein
VDQYKACLHGLDKKGDLDLVNKDFDTGKVTRAGEYSLADETYAKLLDKLADSKFAGISPELREDILAFYRDPGAPNTTKKKRDRWNKTMAELQQLKATQMAAANY